MIAAIPDKLKAYPISFNKAIKTIINDNKAIKEMIAFLIPYLQVIKAEIKINANTVDHRAPFQASSPNVALTLLSLIWISLAGKAHAFKSSDNFLAPSTS
jgi:hypothetical protein